MTKTTKKQSKTNKLVNEKQNYIIVIKINRVQRGHHGRDRMVVGFTTATYAISAYHH